MNHSVSVRLLLTQSDARLVAFARAGHERAFEALVRRYRRPLLSYCRRLLLSEERAEDALQQAFLQAWLALRSGAEVGDAKAWLYRIVHNAALNALRVSGYDYCKLSESLSGADAPQEDLDRRIAVRETLAGLAALPRMQREALLRTAVEGRSHRQVARDLGLSENALRGLVYRARATLRATAGAIVPPPLLTWALGSGGRGTPVVERLAELGAGGGSAGVAGLLLKGGAVAVTASVLAGGVAAVHSHPRREHRRSASHTTRQVAERADIASVALADARVSSIASAAPARQALSHGAPSRAHRLGPRLARIPPRRDTPLTARIAPLPSLAPSSTRGDSGEHRRGDGSRGGGRSGSGGGHEEAQSPSSSGPASGATSTRGGGGEQSGEGGHRSAPTQQGSDSGGSAHRGAPDGRSGEGTSSSGGGPNTASNRQSEGSPAGAGGLGESPELQDSSQAPSSTSTNSSSKDEQASGGEASKGG